MNTLNKLANWKIDQEEISSLIDSERLTQIINNNDYKKSFKKGSYLFHVGEEIKAVHLIVNGRIKTGVNNEENKEVTRSILFENHIMGELFIVGDEKHSFFAYALDNVDVLEIPLQIFKDLITDETSFNLKLLEIINKRSSYITTKLKSLVYIDSRSRIIDYLVELTEKNGEKVGFEYVVRRFLTHQDIANITATSRQTVTTVLNELRDKNLITFNRKRLLVRDLDLLKEESTSN